jgi:lipopolysaccharide heptosyltransferase II
MSSGWNEARNVLCVRLDTIGDVLMTTPAMRALKQAMPGRRLALLTSTRGAEIAPLITELDDTIVYDAPWLKATQHGNRDADASFIERLRRERFDGAVIFTVYTQSALPAAMMCHLAGIPLRLAHCRENPYALLTDWVRETEPDRQIRHETQRQLHLVAEIGCTTEQDSYSLTVPEPARRKMRLLLEEMGVDRDQPWCVLHPGASAESRRYPAESFALVARQLVTRHGWQVVITGSESEREIESSVRFGMRCPSTSLVGRLNLAELSALIALAPVLISNNTAPVHIASAVGTPVVDLYALTNPQHQPWRVPHRVLSADVPCKNCYRSVCPEGHHNCLRLISPAEVVRAALDLADETRVRQEEAVAR